MNVSGKRHRESLGKDSPEMDFGLDGWHTRIIIPSRNLRRTGSFQFDVEKEMKKSVV